MSNFLFLSLFLSSMVFAGVTAPEGVPPKDKEEASSNAEVENGAEPEQKRRRVWQPRIQTAYKLDPRHMELMWALAEGICEGDVERVLSLLRKLTPAQAAVVLGRHYMYTEADLEAFGTPLHLAAFLGDEAMASALIRFAFEVPHGMMLFALGDTAVLQVAAAQGATGVVAALLEVADRHPAFAPFIFAANRFGNALFVAVGKGQIEVLMLLLNFIAPHGVVREDRANLFFAPNPLFRTPLYFSVLTRNPEAARLILAFAASHPELIPLILQNGADGENVLETAALLGETAGAAVVLEFAQDERFRHYILHPRAFRAAARQYHIEIVRMLILSPLAHILFPEAPTLGEFNDDAIVGTEEERQEIIKQLRTKVRNLILLRFPWRAERADLVPGAEFSGRIESAIILLFSFSDTSNRIIHMLSEGVVVDVDLLREMLERHYEWTVNGQELFKSLTRLAGLRLELLQLRARFADNPQVQDNIDKILLVLADYNLTMFQHVATPFAPWLGTGIAAALVYCATFGKAPPK